MKPQRVISGVVTGVLLLSVLALLLTLQTVNFAGKIAHAQQPSQVMFVENVGQFPDEPTRFQAGWGAATLRLTNDALWLTLLENQPVKPQADVENPGLDIIIVTCVVQHAYQHIGPLIPQPARRTLGTSFKPL